MQNRGLAAVIAAIAAVVAVVLFIALSGGSDDSGSTSTTSAGGGSAVPTIVVKDGQPIGGVQDLTFTQGGEIRFIVESDVSDEVHFHGYDIGKEVEAGGQVKFNVPATIAGEFEVELEHRVAPLAEITVNPG